MLTRSVRFGVRCCCVQINLRSDAAYYESLSARRWRAASYCDRRQCHALRACKSSRRDAQQASKQAPTTLATCPPVASQRRQLRTSLHLEAVIPRPRRRCARRSHVPRTHSSFVVRAHVFAAIAARNAVQIAPRRRRKPLPGDLHKDATINTTAAGAAERFDACPRQHSRGLELGLDHGRQPPKTAAMRMAAAKPAADALPDDALGATTTTTMVRPRLPARQQTTTAGLARQSRVGRRAEEATGGAGKAAE